MGKLNDLTGMTFGRLQVIKRAGSNKNKQALWLCECQCEKKLKLLLLVATYFVDILNLVDAYKKKLLVELKQNMGKVLLLYTIFGLI